MGGGLSFRRTEWISELDLCLVKYKCLGMLKKLEVRQDIEGSDHAPITLSVDLKGEDRMDSS